MITYKHIAPPIAMMIPIFALSSCDSRDQGSMSYQNAVDALIDWYAVYGTTKIDAGHVRLSIMPAGLADQQSIEQRESQRHRGLFPDTRKIGAAPSEADASIPFLDIDTEEIDNDILRFDINAGHTLDGDLLQVYLRVIDNHWTVIYRQRKGIK